MINYDNKKFKLVSYSENTALDEDIIFLYRQEGSIVYCNYVTKDVSHGHLIGLVNEKGDLEIDYHQVLKGKIIMTGKCKSTPELLPNGKIRLHEEWKWTNGDMSSGKSILEEI